ncbi:MAG: hypothetical protein KGH79_01015 [Patescibacteria group bacterium]|nr:hypothetical protein [Patescibacteria group bacterium]
MAKWIIGIVVIIIAAAALWWSGWLGRITPSQAPSQTATTTSTGSEQATTQAPINGMSASNNASDAAVTQDTAAIDAQMQGLNSDSANVNSSMNDQAVTQSY